MIKRLAIYICIVSFGLYPWAAAAHEKIAITQAPNAISFTAGGSGVNLGITRILANAFMAKNPDIEIKIPGSIGTKGAIAAVADNAIAFGLISRPLKDSEKIKDAVELPYAKTLLVIGANATTVKDEEMTSQELTAVYSGTKTKWKDGHEIIVQTRENFDSGFMILGKEIPGFKEAHEESIKTSKWSVYYTDQEANQALSKTPYAIGVTDLGMIATEKLNVKPLKLNGVTPNLETMQSGEYTLTRTLYLIYNEKTLPAKAKAFVDFIKSGEAAALLKEHGYLPVAK